MLSHHNLVILFSLFVTIFLFISSQIVFFSIFLIGYFKAGDAYPLENSDGVQEYRPKRESGPTIHPHAGAIIRLLDMKLAPAAAPQLQQVNQEPVSHHPDSNLAAVTISQQQESSTSHHPETVQINTKLVPAAVPAIHQQEPVNNHPEVVHHETKLAAVPAVIHYQEPTSNQSGVVHHETKLLAVAAPVIQEPVRVNLKAVPLDMKVAVAVPVNHQQESASSHHPETVGIKQQMEATTSVAHQQHPLENSKPAEPQHHVVKRANGKRTKKTKGSKKPAVRSQPRHFVKRQASSEHEVDHRYHLGAVDPMAGKNHYQTEPEHDIEKRESENKGEHHKTGDEHRE